MWKTSKYLVTGNKVYFFYRGTRVFYLSSEARKIINRVFLEVKNVTFYRLIRNFFLLNFRILKSITLFPAPKGSSPSTL